MPTPTLTIDPEFRDFFDPLDATSKSLLRDSLIEEGCRESIITWANHDDVIVDGHQRHDICQTNKIPFKINAMVFADRDAVLAWIYRNQVGRRNISIAKEEYIRGNIYNKRKADAHARKGNTHAAKEKPGGHGDHREKTAQTIADEFGVSEKTIRRNAKFANMVDELSEPDRKAILSGSQKPLPVGSDKDSQAEEILALLKRRPATRQELATIAPKYTGRISDLRDKGHNIPKPIEGVYVLEPGPARNGKKKKAKHKPAPKCIPLYDDDKSPFQDMVSKVIGIGPIPRVQFNKKLGGTKFVSFFRAVVHELNYMQMIDEEDGTCELRVDKEAQDLCTVIHTSLSRLKDICNEGNSFKYDPVRVKNHIHELYDLVHKASTHK